MARLLASVGLYALAAVMALSQTEHCKEMAVPHGEGSPSKGPRHLGMSDSITACVNDHSVSLWARGVIRPTEYWARAGRRDNGRSPDGV